MTKIGRNAYLTIKRVYEIKQKDNISFGFTATVDREVNEMHKMVFWLFSQEKTNEYEAENYLGNGFLSIAKALGISEVEACKLFIKKFELALILGFGTIIDKEIERKLKIMKKELKWAKGRAKEEVLKNG